MVIVQELQDEVKAMKLNVKSDRCKFAAEFRIKEIREQTRGHVK